MYSCRHRLINLISCALPVGLPSTPLRNVEVCGFPFAVRFRHPLLLQNETPEHAQFLSIASLLLRGTGVVQQYVALAFFLSLVYYHAMLLLRTLLWKYL